MTTNNDKQEDEALAIGQASPFQSYIQEARDTILNNRPEITHENKASILEANCPKERRESVRPTRGILLVHGLLHGPSYVRSIEEHYVSQGYLVRTLLLPGHGTKPEDLLSVHLEQWLECVAFGIDSFKSQVEHVFVVGFSTGASLALYLNYEGYKVDALGLIAPVFKIKSALTPIAGFMHQLSHVIPRAAWFIKHEETDIAKYQSIPYHAVHQVRRLTKKLLRTANKKQIQAPFMIIASEDDEIVSTQAAREFFDKHHTNQCRFVNYTSHPNQELNSKVLPLNSTYSKERIINFSHQSLPVDASHPQYGKDSNFVDLKHYNTLFGKWFKKSDHEPLYHGAIDYTNLKKYRLSRLSYNPDFKAMMTRLDAFFENIIQEKSLS